jgi:hypothetical protein
MPLTARKIQKTLIKKKKTLSSAIPGGIGFSNRLATTQDTTFTPQPPEVDELDT